ncbi:MAG: hypothetical protein ACYC8T_26735, partial [Myxococcaceae bacterium]
MNRYALLLAACAAALVLCASGCSGKAPCSSNTCVGCCDHNGTCQTGNNNAACGMSGGQCSSCLSIQVCQLGYCMYVNNGGGGGGGGSGGGGGDDGGSGGGGGGGFGGGGGGGGGAACTAAGAVCVSGLECCSSAPYCGAVGSASLTCGTACGTVDMRCGLSQD